MKPMAIGQSFYTKMIFKIGGNFTV